MRIFFFGLLAFSFLLSNVVCDDLQYYYLDKAGERIGPVALDEIQGQFYSGVLTGMSEIFRVGESNWRALASYPDLTDKFSKDRAYDHRSPSLYDVDRFISEANSLPYEADQLTHETLVCARNVAFERVLRKDKIRQLIMNMVPELKTLFDERRELQAELDELQIDVEQTKKKGEQGLEQLKKDREELNKLIVDEVERLRSTRTAPITLKLWGEAKKIFLYALAIWERMLGVPISQPFVQIKGGYIFLTILFIFVVLAQRAGKAVAQKPKRD